MPKIETFQDLSLVSSGNHGELWRWLYTELRAAILDGRLRQAAGFPLHEAWLRSTSFRAALL